MLISVTLVSAMWPTRILLARVTRLELGSSANFYTTFEIVEI